MGHFSSYVDIETHEICKTVVVVAELNAAANSSYQVLRLQWRSY